MSRKHAISAEVKRPNLEVMDSSELKFEIGHVLFIDIVGYSKLLIATSPVAPGHHPSAEVTAETSKLLKLA